MRYYRCKCGESQAWGSMGPWQCQRCAKCGSNLASGPEGHTEPLPHRMLATKVETDGADAALTRCIWCNQTLREIQAKGEPMEAFTP